MAALGLTNVQIAARLHVSVHAVKFHLAGDLPEARRGEPDRGRGRVPARERARRVPVANCSAQSDGSRSLRSASSGASGCSSCSGSSLAFALAFLSFVQGRLRQRLQADLSRERAVGEPLDALRHDPDFRWGSDCRRRRVGDGRRRPPQPPRSAMLAADRALHAARDHGQRAGADGARRRRSTAIVQTFPVTSTRRRSRRPAADDHVLRDLAPRPQRAHQPRADGTSGRSSTFLRARPGRGAASRTAERVQVEVVRQPQAPSLLEPRKKTRPIIVFLTVAIATFGLAFILENLRPRVRAVPGEEPAAWRAPSRPAPDGVGPHARRCSGQRSAGRSSRPASSSARSRPDADRPDAARRRGDLRRSSRSSSSLVVAYRTLLAWPALLAGLVLVILFIPIKRYSLPGNLPFELEPYRLYVALVATLWLARCSSTRGSGCGRAGSRRRSFLFVAAALGSVIFNGARITELDVHAEVTKQLTFFAQLLARLLPDRQRRADVRARRPARADARRRRRGRRAASRSSSRGPASTSSTTSRPSCRPAARATSEAPESIDARRQVRVSRLRAGADRARRGLRDAAAARASTSACATRQVALVDRGRAARARRARDALAHEHPHAHRRSCSSFSGSGRGRRRRFWPVLVPARRRRSTSCCRARSGRSASSFFPEEGLIAQQSQNAGVAGSGRIADLGPALDEFSQTPILGQGYGTRLTGRDEHERADPRRPVAEDAARDRARRASPRGSGSSRARVRRLARAAKEDQSRRTGCSSWRSRRRSLRSPSGCLLTTRSRSSRYVPALHPARARQRAAADGGGC